MQSIFKTSENKKLSRNSAQFPKGTKNVVFQKTVKLIFCVVSVVERLCTTFESVTLESLGLHCQELQPVIPVNQWLFFIFEFRDCTLSMWEGRNEGGGGFMQGH